MHNADAIIIGSGPAGVSAAFPLLEAGYTVLMLDASAPPQPEAIPHGDYLSMQHALEHAPEWKLHASKGEATSPKLRVPSAQHLFEGFTKKNAIEANNFLAVGTLATGGLSRIWGATVFVYNDDDLRDWPINYSDLDASYRVVMQRVGICGSTEALPVSLAPYMQPPMKLDHNHHYILERYRRKTAPPDFSLWEANTAVLTEPLDDRLACNLSGLCLWRCARRSIWNASMDLEKLKQYKNFFYRSGAFVEKLSAAAGGWECRVRGADTIFSAKKIFMAAGALGSARIILATLGRYDAPVSFQTSQMIACMLWLPRRFGAAYENAFGMGQLGFKINGPRMAYGNTYNAGLLPVSEYLNASGLPSWLGTPIFKTILSSCVVAHIAMDGSFSDHALWLGGDGKFHIKGGRASDTMAEADRLKRVFGKSMGALGAKMIPGSFRPAEIGADMRYASVFPMQQEPWDLQTHPDGQLAGHQGLYVVDASAFTALSGKAPTLTAMANADRIARGAC